MLKLFNSLTRRKEDFKPLTPSKVTLYTCGPTVYGYQHIGNWRTFVFEDVLRRTLEFNGYKVEQVMNATDVGHLSGDNLGDADLGEDRIEKSAKREGKSVWEVAQFYLDDFVQTRDWLNILPPTHFVRATDFIKEQIALVQKLLERGLAYETQTGIFFEVAKFPEYGRLSGQKLTDKRVAVREEVEKDKTKKAPQDFALWFKTVGRFANHQMHWSSPWGEGFPGWHIECSSMAMSLLGETIDIHTGGVDHIAIHHTNEIAQSEGATGHEFARFWLHGEFLMVDGGRMGKSLGNAYTLHDIKKKDYDPLSLRYLYLGAHYRDKLNFTWESLKGARVALERLKTQVANFKKQTERSSLSQEKEQKIEDYQQRFRASLSDDLNTSQGLAILWEVAKSNIPSEDKYDLMTGFDEILGLGLEKVPIRLAVLAQGKRVPGSVEKLVKEREEARKRRDFARADEIRNELNKKGYTLEDTSEGVVVRK